MGSKKGIIIRYEGAPSISRTELKSVVNSLETKTFKTIFCDTQSEAVNLLKDIPDEILFIYLTNPLPNADESTKRFIDFINSNENYKHINLYVRLPHDTKKSKYDWDDEFINFIKF